MKEDYLWDKTGEDAEIERLENALAVFRYRETAPPALQPARVVPFKKEASKPRRVKSFAYAIAACLLLAIISLGVWFQISNKKTAETDLAQSQTSMPLSETDAPKRLGGDDEPGVSEMRKPAHGKVTQSHSLLKPARNKGASEHIRFMRVSAKNEKTIARNPKPQTRRAPRLTNEEKYAYDQLMLALSITSSKLKLVKNKVEGMED